MFRLYEFGVGQKDQPSLTATGGAFHFAEIAVGTGASGAEFGQQLCFEVGGDGVLQAFGFVVNLPPFHAEEFGEHAFDEMMAQR